MYCGILLFAVVLGLMVYRYDLYDKEPWYLLLLAAGLGFLASWGIGPVEDWIVRGLGEWGALFKVQAATAAILEEAAKLALVVVIAVGLSRHFNDPMDGLVYGSYVGLGYALFESLLYQNITVANAELQINSLGGEVIRFVLHLLTGGMCGLGVGFGRFRLPGWRRVLVVWVMSAVAIHFCWDAFCGLPAQPNESWAPQRLIAVGLMLTAMGLYGLGVMLGVRQSRAMHSPDAKRRLWGWPFSLLVDSRTGG